MQLESLKMFCDVVETGSFSRAAQLNHVTQSAVSQQIRALENRYEQKLLSRSARQVTPTPAGERLFRGCKEILARFGEVEQEIREQSADVAGTCTVSEKTGRSAEQARAAILARNPLGRAVRPEEVAELVLYLASPAGAALTGAALPVDGGESA